MTEYKTPDGSRLYTQGEVNSLLEDRIFAGGVIASICIAMCVFLLVILFFDRISIAPRNAPLETEATALPPTEYAGGIEVGVRFVPEYAVHSLCADDRALACYNTRGHRIVMPDPCAAEEVRDMRAGDRQNYASILCHELAHARGWDHDDASHVSGRRLFPGVKSFVKDEP